MKLALPVALFIFAMTTAFAATRPTASQEPCLPHIDAVVPSEGQIGSVVRVEGSCFGETPGEILGDGQPLNLLSESDSIGDYAWHDTYIEFWIPAVDDAGPLSITVQSSTGDSDPVIFTIWNYTYPDPADDDCFIVPGRIFFRVAEGVDVHELVADHGDSTPERLFPNTNSDLLSQWWFVGVAEGSEVQKVIEYAGDERVEWAEPDMGCSLGDPVTPTPSPLPSPQPSPAQLPSTGGPP